MTTCPACGVGDMIGGKCNWCGYLSVGSEQWVRDAADWIYSEFMRLKAKDEPDPR